MIYLSTAIGLKPGGSSTVHIYTQTIHRIQIHVQAIHRTTQITTNLEECGPCPSLRVLLRHLPYNGGKSTESPQSG